MTEQSEFLSPQQCFIVYDKVTKKVAISLRNRLSSLGVKCSIWNENQFSDNEARLSNFNRLLILSKKVADEYLAAPSIQSNMITDYVYYKREGRVAALLLKNDIKFDDVFKCFENSMRDLLNAFNITEESNTNQDFAMSLDDAVAESEAKTSIFAIVKRKDTKKIDFLAKLSVVLASVGTGVAFGLVGLTAEYGYFWYKKNLSEEDKKRILLFAGAREFEINYFNDFVNAK